MFEKRERSWLEEERELEQRSWDETWWEKLCRFVRDIFGKCVREAESASKYDTPWSTGRLKVALDWVVQDGLYKDGHITLNELRAMQGLPPVVYSDEELIFHADNPAIVRQKSIEAALTDAKYGISR